MWQGFKDKTKIIHSHFEQNTFYCLRITLNVSPYTLHGVARQLSWLAREAKNVKVAGLIAVVQLSLYLPYKQKVLGLIPKGTTYLIAPPMAETHAVNNFIVVRIIKEFNYYYHNICIIIINLTPMIKLFPRLYCSYCNLSDSTQNILQCCTVNLLLGSLLPTSPLSLLTSAVTPVFSVSLAPSETGHQKSGQLSWFI